MKTFMKYFNQFVIGFCAFAMILQLFVGNYLGALFQLGLVALNVWAYQYAYMR